MKISLLSFIVLLLVMSSVAAIVWTSNSMEGQVSRRVAASQETVLNTTQQALRIWQQETTMNASIIANTNEIRYPVEQQLTIRRRYSNLARSESLHDLRQRLNAYVDQHGYTDFDVISPDGTQIASNLNESLGQTTLADLNRDFVSAIFTSGSKIVQQFELPRKVQRGHDAPSMAVGVPILNDVNEVIAALIFRFDPAGEFTSLTAIGRFGRTGDIYLFDDHARLLTPTRFQTEPGTELRDPGGDTTEGFRSTEPQDKLPLTRMAAAATQGQSGTDLNGYRDYRGVPVAGTWLWDPELGIGLAAEMEMSEAFAPVRTIRALSVVMIAIVTMAVVLLMRVAGHRARLEATNFGYQQALKARQDLLAIVAHDLRNPINSVALSSSILSKMLQEPSPDISFITNNLGVIHRSAFRMNRLIEDLLTSTSIETGQLRIHPRECDLRVLLHEFEEVVVPLVNEKSIELVCSVGDDLPKAFVDPDRLIQVLSNLVGNAIKYTPPHAVVVLSVQSHEGEVRFSVKDSGPGIPAAELPRIFDQYWQGQHNKGGSGLGLYISKAFVEAHGGCIWIESSVGQGTTVYFSIPVTGATIEKFPEKRAS